MIDKEKFSTEDQQEFRLGVGMLFSLVKPLYPDHTNATRELFKANDGANPAVYKELLCVIKYVLDMKNHELKIEPMGSSNKLWKIVYFSHCNYAGDPVSRRSISGSILYVLGVPVSLQSKLQKRVSLSRSEAECVALSEAVTEVMLIIQLLGSIKIFIKYSVTVRMDNIGAIFITSNITTTCCTKHRDIRYRYINQYLEDIVVEMVFVKSTHNDSNIHAKNLSAELHEKKSRKIMVEEP